MHHPVMSVLLPTHFRFVATDVMYSPMRLSNYFGLWGSPSPNRTHAHASSRLLFAPSLFCPMQASWRCAPRRTSGRRSSSSRASPHTASGTTSWRPRRPSCMYVGCGRAVPVDARPNVHARGDAATQHSTWASCAATSSACRRHHGSGCTTSASRSASGYGAERRTLSRGAAAFLVH